MKIIFVVLTNILLFACVNNNRTDAPELLDKILDKQILIKNHSYCINGKDTLISDMMDTSHFKIVIFAESSDCERCSWRLEEWFLKKKELSLLDKNPSFIFIVQSKNRNLTEHYIREALPDIPVIYDSTSNFISANGLPQESAYHTLLLDKNNRVRQSDRPSTTTNCGSYTKKKSTINLTGNKQDGYLGQRTIPKRQIIN